MSATPEGLRVSTGLRLSTQSSFWVASDDDEAKAKVRELAEFTSFA